VLDYCREILSSLESPPGIIAVDCPSGMDCDSGEAASEVLKADMTVTMAAVKLGMLRFPAFGLIGALRIVDIGLPDGLKSWQKIRREVVDAERVRGLLPERPLDSHKGTFGTVMVVGGSVNYTGAPLMAGKAAYRGGAGLVSLAVPTSLHGPLAGVFPEAVWLLLPDEMGVIGSAAAALIRRNLDSVTALAVGPGLGQESSTQDFLRLLFREHSGPARRKIGFVPNSAEKEDDPEDNSDKFPPVILDADGLKLLARIPSWEDRLPGLAVLTPHPGEMSILTGLEIAEIQANRLETAEKYSLKWGHVVVLKGAGTIIAAPDGNTGIIPIATPALARAGTGDILTGLIAGLRAQGLGAYEAAIAGAWIHAEAGLMAAEFSGTDISILAGDILETIQDVLAFCQNTP
jgi:ADP-dependent NAD(P)H-hydrate dehydratase / NAD(P)H-hydrate epimerase